MRLVPLFLAAPAGGLDVWALVMDSGPMAKFILFVLIAFSVLSWGLILARWRTFARAQRESDVFLERFKKGGGLASIQDATAGLTWSPLAGLFRAAFREISLNPPAGEVADAATIGALDRVLRKNISVQVTDLEKSLGFLATTAGATPFIGLFGTVWGIMSAFADIGRMGSANLAVVAPGISEALITTAMGLLAAIPAAVFYNFFSSRIRVLGSMLDDFAMEFLNIVERNFT